MYYIRVSVEEFNTLKTLRKNDPLFSSNGGMIVVDVEKVDAKVYLDKGLPTLAMALSVWDDMPKTIETMTFRDLMSKEIVGTSQTLTIQMWTVI